MVLQLSRKRLLDDEFQESATDHRHFWRQWLHGNKQSKAQEKAASAAGARAEAADLPVHNSFDILAEQASQQVI